MSTNAMMNRIITAVTNAQTVQGQAVLYAPLLEFIIIQVLTELAADVGVAAADQTAFTNVLAATTGDATP